MSKCSRPPPIKDGWHDSPPSGARIAHNIRAEHFDLGVRHWSQTSGNDFIVSSYFLEISSVAQFIISLFALVVLTTATLEKFILEKRYEYQKQEVIRITGQNEEALTGLKQLSQDYQVLYQKYLQSKKKR